MAVNPNTINCRNIDCWKNNYAISHSEKEEGGNNTMDFIISTIFTPPPPPSLNS
jgi:hypothetical protein